MHILLVRFSSMGDVVLQTATVNWLRSLFGEGLKISFLTSKEFASLLDNHPGIDQVITYDRRNPQNWSQLVKTIKGLKVDLVLDLHGTLRSSRLRMSLWFTPWLTVDKRRWERFLLVKLKGVFFKRLINEETFGLGPQVERIIKDIENIFGGKNGLWRTQEFRHGPHNELTSLPKDSSYPIPGPYIVIAPSASFHFKRWPVEKFVYLAQSLLEKIPHHIVILAGPDDSFCKAFDVIDSSHFHNLQGKTSLRESMQILANAQLSVGNDSGMNHIAEAYGVPCLTLFGPTDPRFGFAPHGNKSRLISKELWCKPCSTTGSKSCFRDRHYCMELISVEEVQDLCLKTLERS